MSTIDNNEMTTNNKEKIEGSIRCWLTWCRLCAKDDAQGNISVFLKDQQQNDNNSDSDLVKSIEKFFWINIKREDVTLPQMLCSECFSMLTSLVNYTERVARTQQMYMTLQNYEHISETELYATRLKYGLVDDGPEHVFVPPLIPEVHYLEEKPTVNELGEVVNVSKVKPFENVRIKLKQIPNEEKNVIEQKLHDNDEEMVAEGEVSEKITPLEQDPIQSNDDRLPSDDNIEPMDNDLHDDDYDLNETSDDGEVLKDKEVMKKIIKIKQKLPRIKRKKYQLRNVNHDDETNRNEEKNENIEDNQDSHEIYSCGECLRKFKRLHHYSQHMKLKHSKDIPMPEVKCSQCSREFTNKRQLDRHKRNHLPPELKYTIPCRYCEKKFACHTVLRLHVRQVHMNERPFICEECGVAVYTKVALNTHMLTHTDYAPFECEICKKGFKNALRLKNHMETHDPTKHICALCGLQLNSRATLNRHLLVHSDKMQHKCDYCGRAFKRAKALKNHLILHTGLKPYSCDFCDRTFANGSNCRSHKKKAHPVELAALEAAGGGKTYTRNIPKLEALKAVTKTADNLEPVVSKQSGCFAFGKKPKPTKDVNNKQTKSNKAIISNSMSINNTISATTATQLPDVATNLIANATTAAMIPAIDNIYNHIMKQANFTAAHNIQNASSEQQQHQQQQHISATNAIINIKRPPSEASSCHTVENDATNINIEISSNLQMQQQFQLHQHHHQQQQQQQQTASILPINMAQRFNLQLQKQNQLIQQQGSLSNQTSHHLHLRQQTSHENLVVAIRSPDSQASNLSDDRTNAPTQFFNQIRQNLQAAPYM